MTQFGPSDLMLGLPDLKTGLPNPKSGLLDPKISEAGRMSVTSRTTLFKESFNLKSEVRYECFQMVKISSDKMDVINVYRSSDANNSLFLTITFSKK